MQKLIKRLREFNSHRNWDKFHTPKNLSMAISVECAELMELFQWKTEKESWVYDRRIETELADIFIYLLILADKLKIDLIKAANKKIEINGLKYPVI